MDSGELCRTFTIFLVIGRWPSLLADFTGFRWTLIISAELCRALICSNGHEIRHSRACERACERACACTCVCACVYACVSVPVSMYLHL